MITAQQSHEDRMGIVYKAGVTAGVAVPDGRVVNKAPLCPSDISPKCRRARNLGEN